MKQKVILTVLQQQCKKFLKHIGHYPIILIKSYFYKMKKWLFLILFFCICNLLKAQLFSNGNAYIPTSQTFSTDSIANYVKQHYENDLSRVHAIYSWVTTNIRYDKDSANIINLGTDPNAKITAALRRRKGVCENFAAIFNDICLQTGLTSFLVDGYTKQGGSVDKSGHAWCAVLIDRNWMLFDPTWDVGGNDKYFLVQPSEMIASHMPYDPMWQLLHYPVSHQQFNSGNIYENKQQPFFNYADSISAFSKMDSLGKFRSSALRIEQSGLYNDMVKNRLNYNKMHIEMIRQDKDVDLYNSSVAYLNDVMNTYNNFIQYRNKQFTPAIPDNALQGMLDGVDKKLMLAHKNLDEIAKSEATFTFSTEALRDKLNALAIRIKEQKEFLSIYLNTAKANRQSLFYKAQLTSLGK